jgi:hypothetical protein
MLRVFALLDHVDADRKRGHVTLQAIKIMVDCLDPRPG